MGGNPSSTATRPGHPAEAVSSGEAPTGSRPEALRQAVADHLRYSVGRLPAVASRHDYYRALALAVRDRVQDRWTRTTEACFEHGRKIACYFSAESLLGPHLGTNLLKPNMVIPGRKCARQVSVTEVAASTLRCLRRHAPAAVPGIVLLSGGQDPVTATRHLNAINQLTESKPWPLTFSYGRALQDEALAAWQGKTGNLEAGQQAFRHRARCDSAAAVGRYSTAMEDAILVAKR